MIAWAVEAVIASTALMLLVMIVRRPVAEHFGAQAAYALWALPALRMVMPPLMVDFGGPGPMSTVAPVSGRISDIVRDSVLMSGEPVQASATITSGAAASGSANGWIALAVLIWLVGALLFVAGHMWGYRLFRAHMLKGSTVLGDAAPGINLVSSPQANGPMAFGLRRRVIVFPQDSAERFNEDEHALALAHELAHHRRGDLIANAFALAVVSLHWWNPVAWIAYRMFRADQEVACDAQVVIEARRKGLAQVYGRALIKAATNREFAVACHLTSVDTLKRRLAMLAKKAPSARRRWTGLALIGCTMLGGLALTASGRGVAADVGKTVSAAMPEGRVKALLAAPATPASPARPAQVARLVDEQPTSAETEWTARGEAVDRAQSAVAPELPQPPAPPARGAWATPPTPPVPPVPPKAGSAWSDTAGAEARREADLAAREAERERRLAMAEAAREQRLARAEMARANHEGERERLQAQREADLARTQAERARIVAERSAMRVPQVSVTENCAGTQADHVSRTEMVDKNGRRTISINVCGEAIARNARAQAIQGLRQARLSIVNNQSLSADIRASIQRDFDHEIARLGTEHD